MRELWGALIIFIICPLLGGLPVIAWITQAMSKKRLAQMGTGNISVSAAFYHGGTVAGTLAVVSEALKGVAAVLLARSFFGEGSGWEIVSLIALVAGRYWMGGGAGTTNAVWGFIVHDPRAAIFVLLLAGVSFTTLRDRSHGKFTVLFIFPIILTLLNANDGGRILAAVALAIFLGWIYKQIPDDLDLPPGEVQQDSQAVFEFFRGDKAILTLEDELDARLVGAKAARLSQIKGWGYPVPKGWALLPGDDPTGLLESLYPSELSPLVVRSSAIGEDSEQASAAGQYDTVLNVTTREGLEEAIVICQESYKNPSAIQYRRDRGLKDTAMAVLIQQQIRGIYSGVAFSRDPMTQQGDAVVIEALSGNPSELMAGKVTPEQYRAFVVETDNMTFVQSEGQGTIPQAVIKQVAYLARHLEERYFGIPQDVEWIFDGSTVWVLQARPITTLLPIWTRKIAAEVIPGVIRPLTWSINRPLTCGVWGEIFTLVLGQRARGLNFEDTATLHFSRAYFNASLLGKIFRRMGLPPESLEFLTRGASMSKPPLNSTLQNLPGLLRLLNKEFWLGVDFRRDYLRRFIPGLSQLAQEILEDLEPNMLLRRIDFILGLLKQATYYSILTPLSVALRQSIFKVKDWQVDNSMAPEVAALRALSDIAGAAKKILPVFDTELVFLQLGQTNEGREILARFDTFVQHYGYLSEVGTDISVTTWAEDPQAVRQMFIRLMETNEPLLSQDRQRKRKGGSFQRRVDLKGKVTTVYSKLLAELRWCFVALEDIWLQSGILKETGDIFFLEFEEIRSLIEGSDDKLLRQVAEIVRSRRDTFTEDSRLNPLPLLVYGNTPPAMLQDSELWNENKSALIKGIAASPGQVEGKVKVVRGLEDAEGIDKETILVVPYTDSGWAPLLARAGGLIAEVGGRLSHGAIVAREYGIPAVMDVHNATWLLQDGQWVRLDGYRGTVEMSNDLRPR